jgi:hypothetical protein
VHVTRTTGDHDLATQWLARFEGAGLDGVIAKPLALPYAPGKRTMFKIKHARTADVVLLGYRVHKSGHGVGSLLLGLYDENGDLRNVGGRRPSAMCADVSSSTSWRLSSSRMPRARRDRADRPLALLRRRTPRSSGCGRSACSRCATTSSKAHAFATRCSSSGGGPTATRARAPSQLEQVRAYDLADVLD